ncbi:MAG: glycoside hydrolase family 20 protein [Bacteroidales bacterium]|nr:glycoside hydrolase family 20 protein [Bacteroidales bacterium]
MRRNVALLACLLLMLCSAWAQEGLNIIPQPSKVEMRTGKFSFDAKSIKIFGPRDENMRQEAEYLNDLFTTHISGYENPVYTRRVNAHANMDNSIIFIFTCMRELGEEGYVLDINQRRITIEANTGAGFFYGVQTLLQMLGTNFCIGNKIYQEYKRELPCCRIVDYPRFAYRGKHLDCSRHFWDAEYIKKYIDMLAFHKINTFHWHLTDDQGWRIEIKKYPLLTEVGSKRKQTLVGHYSDTPVDEQVFDGKEYGGFYTQEEIKEIVEYAKQRHITIIPEIEIPGHALAALSAYPELGCIGGKYDAACTWGVFDDVMCSKEETFHFIEGVLDEVCALFPSEYIHIGGDECPSVRWKECDVCQANIKRLGLKDETQLQGYFTKRVEDYLKTKGRRMIGWDEILEKGVEKSATIMSWQGEMGGIAAAKQGNDAIMVPSAYLYFNFYQGVAATEPLAFGGFTPLKKVYTYEPVPSELTPEQAKHIIGMQACTWTEYIGETKNLEYNDMPRMAALSERAWSSKDVRDYDNFVKRLNSMLDCYDAMGLNYAKSHFAVNANIEKKKNKLLLSLSSPLEGAPIYYTLDGSTPMVGKSKVYSKPITLTADTKLKAVAYKSEHRFSPILSAQYNINKATGKSYEQKDINPQYNGGGGLPLTDGLTGDKKSYDRWVGTLGKDYDVTLDLEEKTEIHSISLNFLDEEGSWIFLPKSVKAYVSNDKKTWIEIEENEFVKSDVKDNLKVVNYKTTSSKLSNGKYRYVRIFAPSLGMCPEGHPGYGYPVHTFVDEIEIK